MPGATPNLGRTVVRGTFWTYASYYSGKLLVFLSTIILARLLSKDDFGIAGYAVVVIGFLDVLTDLGVGPAIIYYRDHPHAPDTAFWLGMVVSVILCVLTILGAPLAGILFNDPRAVSVTRLLALTFPLSALGNIHDMLLRKELSFGRKFIPDLVRSFGKGIISIILALLHFGPWSLIIGQLVGTALASIVFWWVYPWRPSFQIVREIVRPLLSYGLGMVSVDAVGMVLTNADYLFVGRYLGAAALGVYSLAFRIPELLIVQFCYTISKVIFPVYARMRDDPTALSRGFITTLQYVSLVTIPMGLGIALVAKPFVLVLFTDKWIEAIPVVQAISIYALMISLAFNAGDVYKAQGRPALLTELSLVRAVLLIPALFWAVLVPGTLEAIAWVQAVVAFLAGLLQLVVAGRMLQTPLLKIGEALVPAALGGLGMSAVVLPLLSITGSMPAWLQLFVAVIAGGIVYLGLVWFLKRELLLSAVKALLAAVKKQSQVSV